MGAVRRQEIYDICVEYGEWLSSLIALMLVARRSTSHLAH